jgi:hypothetical protein
MRGAALCGWSLAVATTVLVFGGCTSLLGDFKSSSTESDASVHPGSGEASPGDRGAPDSNVTVEASAEDGDSAATDDVSDGGCGSTSTVQNCGRCGHDCSNLPHVSGMVACTTAGACIYDSTACAPGYADCDGNPDTGCETDLSLPTHCGTCSTTCGGATPTCVPGSTGSSFSCASGCPSTAPTLCSGSCSNTASDAKNCSSCGNACPPPANGQPACNGGACGITCNSGYHNCSGACLSNLSPASCGTSCNACAAPPNATVTCDGTKCTSSCNGGFHTCNGVCSDNTSVNSCGTSCTPCSAPANATPGCSANGCYFTCNANTISCGSTCVDPASDPSNCGSCGHVCPAGVSCEGKLCIVRYGYTAAFGSPSSFGANNLLGELISVPTNMTLTALGVVMNAANIHVIMALYTNAGGAPGTVIASTASTTTVVGKMEMPVTNVGLAAGTYWIMGEYDTTVTATLTDDFCNCNSIDYVSITYPSVPYSFPTPSTYTSGHFPYYVVGYE